MYQDDMTVLEIDQTFQLPQPIDTLVSVNVEPSQLIETKEGLRGTLDLIITYEPCEERENEADITQEALLITDVRTSVTNEVCAYFSFPLELYGISEKTHVNVTVSELDYLLPTRSTFTLKAKVQVFHPNVRKDEDETTTVSVKQSIMNVPGQREPVKEETDDKRAPEKVLEEDVLVYTPKKQMDQSSERTSPDEAKVAGQLDEKDQVTDGKDATDRVVALNIEAETIKHQKQLTDQADILSTEANVAQSSKRTTEAETEEEEIVATKEINGKDTRVIYQHYGLKGLANPHVKLPCVIVKEAVSVTEWCHQHGLDVTRFKRVNAHVEETVQLGQVLILPDGVSYT